MKTLETVLAFTLIGIFSLSSFYGSFKGNFELRVERRFNIFAALWYAIKFWIIAFIIFAIALLIVETASPKGWIELLIAFPVTLLCSFIVFKVAKKRIQEKSKDVFDPIGFNKTNTSTETTGQMNHVAVESCPFKGRIMAEVESSILGFSYDKLEEILIIHDNWLVSSKEDSSFGWIDSDGYIHKGFPPTNYSGVVDYKATLHMSEKIGNITSTGFWVGNEKIGKYAF